MSTRCAHVNARVFAQAPLHAKPIRPARIRSNLQCFGVRRFMRGDSNVWTLSAASSGRNSAIVRRRTRANGPVLIVALVNVDLGPSTVVGMVLIAAGAALYQVRAVSPSASRDYDIFFSSVALLVGGILCFQGWRLDPLLLFGQILTITAAIAFGVEAIQLRKGREAEAEIPPWEDALSEDRARRGSTSYRLPQPSSRQPIMDQWGSELESQGGRDNRLGEGEMPWEWESERDVRGGARRREWEEFERQQAIAPQPSGPPSRAPPAPSSPFQDAFEEGRQSRGGRPVGGAGRGSSRLVKPDSIGQSWDSGAVDDWE